MTEREQVGLAERGVSSRDGRTEERAGGGSR